MAGGGTSSFTQLGFHISPLFFVCICAIRKCVFLICVYMYLSTGKDIWCQKETTTLLQNFSSLSWHSAPRTSCSFQSCIHNCILYLYLCNTPKFISDLCKFSTLSPAYFLLFRLISLQPVFSCSSTFEFLECVKKYFLFVYTRVYFFTLFPQSLQFGFVCWNVTICKHERIRNQITLF